MTSEPDEYDIFLQTWEPSERLIHACLPQNLHDPFSRKRLFKDSTGSAPVARTPFNAGHKVMADDESIVRAYDFFKNKQACWSAHFRDYVLKKNVPSSKLDIFVTSFSKLWIDGMKRRQDSPEMQAIKASIRDYDHLYYPDDAGRFVINPINNTIEPLFTPDEMAEIFNANDGLISALMPDYIDCLEVEGPSSLDDLYVRRGVFMPSVGKFRQELNYLSSYSLTLGPVEQFAKTWSPETKDVGKPRIFSAPLPAIQRRIVAFAPFIEGMDLRQLEFVIAPPVEETPLQYDGEHGGIHEYSFD